MSFQQDKVIILKKTVSRETDLIVDTISSHGFLLRFIARGAVKSKKRFGGGVLEPTHFAQVSYKPRGLQNENQLQELNEATLINTFSGLRGDYDRMMFGLELVEYIRNSVREAQLDSVDLFNLLGNTLKMAEIAENLPSLRVHFLVRLLASQGVIDDDGDWAGWLEAPITEHSRLPEVIKALPAQELERLKRKSIALLESHF